MDPTRRGPHRLQRGARLALIIAAVAAVLVTGGLAVWLFVLTPPAPASDAATGTPTPAASSTPSPTPLTPAETLLATTGDPNTCAVGFAGDGITDGPTLQTQGTRYAALPLPSRPGAVFAGWYPTPEAASALDAAARVNGADLVTCTDRQATLYGAWTTPEVLAAADVAVPILMYHQFTTNPAGENSSLKLNYIYTGDFDAQMAYLADTGTYLPTWDELAAFIDGHLLLPARSAIITDDDADRTWLELGVPIIDAHRVLATSFVITKWRSEPTPSVWVQQRSHTHDMHEAGANGEGRMVNWSAAEIAADLTTSAQILGAAEVVAYPFGHYNDTAKAGVSAAGFELARTIEQGYVRVGTDKLALPCIRVNYGTTLAQFVAAVG
ncbi:MAG: polysaccharide deacetylase family protein [Microbacterium sp.]|uniref:polysaccharide deacetylase family protein n=1 Tax=Microbacterium sp. TaxID=51671 RepID=UPI002627099A|nr:polysaccharide deacetylase family protein [Microbacterium sp.]MCX6501439.1 polysaccharide deacetylase family protein [Microbacterium sp.]